MHRSWPDVTSELERAIEDLCWFEWLEVSYAPAGESSSFIVARATAILGGGFLELLGGLDQSGRAANRVALDLLQAGWSPPEPDFPHWTRDCSTPPEVAVRLVIAMEQILGCALPDGVSWTIGRHARIERADGKIAEVVRLTRR